jgi:hypothetical protein
LKIVEDTDEVQRLLERLSFNDCFNPEVWRQLLFFGLIIPDGDVLPIRTAYDEATDAHNIGLNSLKSDMPLWYAGPDVLASKVLTGKIPKIVKAYRLVPEAQQSGLGPARLRDADSMLIAVKLAWAKLRRAASIEELRAVEGEAARAYWLAWRGLPVRFKRRDSQRIPEHWLSFGTRSSPLSRPSPRRAVNPANALLNYVYAIVEAETRIGSIAVGLDPAIGIMHSDLRARDSLSCDLMEAIRPQADEFVLELIRNREFRKNDFFETREGICRVLPPLSQEIAKSDGTWRKSIGPVVEEVALTFFKGAPKYLNREIPNNGSDSFATRSANRLPTPLTESNRSAGRVFKLTPDLTEVPPKRIKSVKRASRKLDCVMCGKQIDGKHRMYCDSCLGR